MTIITSLLPFLFTGVVEGQNHGDIKRPEHWKGLVFGGRFMDRFESLRVLNRRTADTWGVDGVKPRDITLGIEDPAWSYWGGNIMKGDDGKYHLFVCRWAENHPKGHMAWRQSEVVRAVSDNHFGPFKVQAVIGKGHNPEAYRLQDGRYVCYAIGCFYLGKTIKGPWERKEAEFKLRDRRIPANLSNQSFASRDDGSFMMVNRGGGIWVSRDGLDSWHQVTQGSNYPKVKGAFEDPVIWHTGVQYHMIVNDWHGRIAYHLRSKDGAAWKVDSGEAYMPGLAVYPDGRKEDWYKYERIKILQDEHGRAILANFAVIDYPKRKDLPNDIHSSKNLPIPLIPGRLIELLNPEIPRSGTGEIRVRIRAEEDFDPHRDIDFESLRFGAPEEVDFARGSRLLHTEKDGRDLIAVFAVEGHGFEGHNFAGKLLGRTAGDKLLFGYTRLPWVTYDEPILSARCPVVSQRDGKQIIEVQIANFGLTSAEPSPAAVAVLDRNGKRLLDVKATCPALDPWASATLELEVETSLKEPGPYRFKVTTGQEFQTSMVYESKTKSKKKKR